MEDLRTATAQEHEILSKQRGGWGLLGRTSRTLPMLEFKLNNDSSGAIPVNF